MRSRIACLLACAALLSGLFPIPVSAASKCTQLKNNYVARVSTTFCAGTYSFADSEGNGVIIVQGSGSSSVPIVIDGSGLKLTGKSSRGYGVYLKGQHDVVIKNFSISGYYYGMRLETAQRLTVVANQVSRNKKDTSGSYLDINRPLASAYGGGMLLNGVSQSTFQRNTLQNQNVGIDVYGGGNNTIGDLALPSNGNNASSNTAWGIRLFGSTGNTVANNVANHNVRCSSGWCGLDSAALLVTNGSNSNYISNNDLTYSGDGFFLGNQYSVPSNDNTVFGNNGSYSYNNAFEATFSAGNVLRGNTANSSNYGFWLGYSNYHATTPSTVDGNTILNNRYDGINIDRGQRVTISSNTITGNGGYGVALTYQPADPTWADAVSSGHTLTGNTVTDNGAAGVYFQGTTKTVVGSDGTVAGKKNEISGNYYGLQFTGASTGNVVNYNNIVCTSSTLKKCQDNAYSDMESTTVDATSNWWGSTVEDTIVHLIYGDGIKCNPWLGGPAS